MHAAGLPDPATPRNHPFLGEMRASCDGLREDAMKKRKNVRHFDRNILSTV
jgi:hypothetical protein